MSEPDRIGIFSRAGLEAVVAPRPPHLIAASARLRPVLDDLLASFDRSTLPVTHGEVRPGIAGPCHVRLLSEVPADDPRWPTALAAWLDRRSELHNYAVTLLGEEDRTLEVLP